jgi:hypothetical protein
VRASLTLEGDQVAVGLPGTPARGPASDDVPVNECAEQAFLPMLYGCPHWLRLVRVVDGAIAH